MAGGNVIVSRISRCVRCAKKNNMQTTVQCLPQANTGEEIGLYINIFRVSSLEYSCPSEQLGTVMYLIDGN